MIFETLNWEPQEAKVLMEIIKRANPRVAIGVISKTQAEQPKGKSARRKKLDKRQVEADARRAVLLHDIRLSASKESPVLARALYETGVYDVSCSRTISSDLNYLWNQGLLNYVLQENDNCQTVRAYWAK